MAGSYTFESLFLKTVSFGVTGYVKGSPLKKFKIISFGKTSDKTSDKFTLQFEIVDDGFEKNPGKYFLDMAKDVKTSDIIMADVSFTLSVQKLGPDNKMKNVIRVRSSNEDFVINRNASIRFEQIRNFWEKLIKLSMTERAKIKRCH